MGNMEYRRASFLDAISFYDKAIALCPQNAACHYNKAASLIGLGRLTESMEECLQAIKCDPSCSCAHHRLGILYARFEQEVLTAEKAVDLDTTRKSLKWLRKARAAADTRKDRKTLFKDGKYLEACTKYGHGLQYVRTNSVLLCNRASCKSKLGQWEKAIDDCNAALRERPNYHKALLRRAHSYARGTLSFGDEDGDGICKI